MCPRDEDCVMEARAAPEFATTTDMARMRGFPPQGGGISKI